MILILNYKSEITKVNDVFRIKIDIPWSMKFVCLYLFEVAGKKVLIDAGYSPEEWKKVLYSAFADLSDDSSISIKDIDYCIISHEHTDHIGLVKDFKQDNPNIKICMHEFVYEIAKLNLDEENFRGFEDRTKEMADMIVKYGLGEREGNFLAQMFSSRPMHIDYIKPDLILHDNDEIIDNKLKIIFTPGHALGHICIFDKEKKYLFSGDHILSRITPHIGMFGIPKSIEQNPKYDFQDILDTYLKSLDRIDDLNPKIIFPGHQKIIYNPHERITEIKNHHQNRLYEISLAIKDKWLTPYEVSRIHFGEELDELNSILALSEVLGHFIYLEKRSKVTRKEENGKIYFRAEKSYEKNIYK